IIIIIIINGNASSSKYHVSSPACYANVNVNVDANAHADVHAHVHVHVHATCEFSVAIGTYWRRRRRDAWGTKTRIATICDTSGSILFAADAIPTSAASITSTDSTASASASATATAVTRTNTINANAINANAINTNANANVNANANANANANTNLNTNTSTRTSASFRKNEKERGEKTGQVAKQYVNVEKTEEYLHESLRKISEYLELLKHEMESKNISSNTFESEQASMKQLELEINWLSGSLGLKNGYFEKKESDKLRVVYDRIKLLDEKLPKLRNIQIPAGFDHFLKHFEKAKLEHQLQ
ncbi:cyclin-like F-box containing protein, partial [Reticulomyxa filosa]